MKASHWLIIINLREQRNVEKHCVKGGVKMESCQVLMFNTYWYVMNWESLKKKNDDENDKTEKGVI